MQKFSNEKIKELITINQDKAKAFMEELYALQNKHGIYLRVEYDDIWIYRNGGYDCIHIDVEPHWYLEDKDGRTILVDAIDMS